MRNRGLLPRGSGSALFLPIVTVEYNASVYTEVQWYLMVENPLSCVSGAASSHRLNITIFCDKCCEKSNNTLLASGEVLKGR